MESKLIFRPLFKVKILFLQCVCSHLGTLAGTRQKCAKNAAEWFAGNLMTFTVLGVVNRHGKAFYHHGNHVE